jgi:hypothetical integral membrane protein (TIGR02206 family)
MGDLPPSLRKDPGAAGHVVPSQFHLFGPHHLVIIALIPLLAGSLTWLSRKSDSTARKIRISIAVVILVDELAWYGYYLSQGWFAFPYSLPLQLCDITFWLTVYTLFTKSSRVYQLIYYWGLAGTTMAVLTPDVSTPPLSWLTLQFFIPHGGLLVGILFLTWRKILVPLKGSYWKAWLWLHVYAALTGLFNYAFQENYFYLCEKPTEMSLLEFMGPWPWYILVGDLIALVTFWLLWLPFRKKA